ncbi:MAG: hypothetical protein U5K72_04585 [Balneolaceae bacterium]|nr:hypothetical protein [Balneolaceae bacterium]
MKVFVYWVVLIDENCPVINEEQIDLKSKLRLFNQERSEQLKIGAELIQKADNHGNF